MTDLTAIATRFARETTDHQLEVLHDDGLYRHLLFQGRVWRPPLAKPLKTSFYWFEIITAPGSLTFRGDGDSYVFARLPDMFEFFRGHRVNPGYWAEKLTSNRDAAMVYSEDLFLAQVAEAIADAVRYGDAPAGLAETFEAEARDWHDTSYEDNARQLLDSFVFDGWRFSDTWEWQLRDYDWWLLWAMHAIVWGIGQYDQAKGQCTYDVRKPLTPGAPQIVTERATGGVL